MHNRSKMSQLSTNFRVIQKCKYLQWKVLSLFLKLSLCSWKGAVTILESSEKPQKAESKTRGFGEEMSHNLIKNITAKARKRKDTPAKTLKIELV